MSGAAPRLVVVTLADGESARQWYEIPEVEDVVSGRHIATSGYRFGVRAFGLGIDALVVAARAILRRRKVTYVATNPWIGVFIRLLSTRPLVVTGLYAEPGSRSWRVFRMILRGAALITLSPVEAKNWSAAGGTAVSVKYGNEFPYAEDLNPREGPPIRVFVGGSSDRDLARLRLLEREVLESNQEIELRIAIGDPRREDRRGPARVVSLPRLEQSDFGHEIAASDITYLPLVRKERSAGHMIIVGSLQVGTPVLVTGGGGVEGYIDGKFVRESEPGDSPLSSLLSAYLTRPSRRETHEYWRSRFSRSAYLRSIREAIRELAPRGADFNE